MRPSIPEAKNGQQQQTDTTPGPKVAEMNTVCQDDASLETGGAEKESVQHASEHQASINEGCRKGRKNRLYIMTHTVLKRLLPAVLDCSAASRSNA